MKAVYGPYVPNASDGNCGFCQSALTKKQAAAHAGDGYKHAMHLACVKILANQGINRCLFCNVETECEEEIKDTTPIKWKKVCVREIKSMAADALIGMGAGMFVFGCQFGLGDEAARQAAISLAASISLGFGGKLAMSKLAENGYNNATGAVLLSMATAAFAGAIPPILTAAGAAKGIVDFGSVSAYGSFSGLSVVSGLAISAGTIIGTAAALAYEDNFVVNKWVLGKFGAALGAAASAIAVGLAGLDFDQRRFELYDQHLSPADGDIAARNLFLTVLGTSVALVKIGSVVGGFLGRRLSRL